MMLYQKMLIGSEPYFISVGMSLPFEAHRHPEMELNYCMEGVYDIICENKRYSLQAGDFIIVPPMVSHEIPHDERPCKKMTVEVGYALLGKHFEAFENLNANGYLYKKDDAPIYKQLNALLNETAALHESDLLFHDLSIKGNLYKISALLLQLSHALKADRTQNKTVSDIKKIDQALEKIYNNYYEPLNVEEISAFCGYSKSNFCKIFKTITGETFHKTLNRHRIEVSCMLLRETNYTIEKISQETGFPDTKSFCRVFKTFMGKSAGEYKKSLKAE